MKKYSIFIRPFQQDDYLIINTWRNDPEIQKMTGGPIRFVSLEIEKEWVNSKMKDNTNNLYWAICVNDETKKMIGYISLNNIDHLNKTAFAGGSVIGDKEYRDGTTIFESLSMVLDYAFLQLNINRISTWCLPEHYFAPHSLFAFGFEKEGVERQALYKNGSYHDIAIYSLLREDYDKINKDGGYEIPLLVGRCIKHIKNNKK